MTSTTETFWDIDGASLQTYAWNIETLGGDRMAPPRLRGADLTVPTRPGTVWTPKVPDAKTITLGMWVQGSNADGTIPQNENARRTFDRNWRMLRNLLWRPGQQFTLGKRFWVPTEELEAANAPAGYAIATEGEWSLIYAQTKASFGTGLTPSMQGGAHAAFTVDLVLNDPFFYSAPLEIEFSATTGAGLSGPDREFSVLGDYRTTKIAMHFEGPLTTPRLTLLTAPHETWFQYASPIADGDTVDTNVDAFEVIHTATDATYRAAGNVRHKGDWNWFYLQPGATRVVLSVQEGTGVGSLSYFPAWL